MIAQPDKAKPAKKREPFPPAPCLLCGFQPQTKGDMNSHIREVHSRFYYPVSKKKQGA